jgi:uncharacterized protein
MLDRTSRIRPQQLAIQRQYSLQQIILLWLLVTIPMGVSRFWIMPQFKHDIPMHPGIFFWLLIILGMVWQFVLSMIVLKTELKVLNWSTLKARLWLNHPIDPKTHKVDKRAYWLTIPLILYGFALEQTGLLDVLQVYFVRAFPAIAPPDYVIIQNLGVPEFRGAWYLVGILLFSSLFNYLLGEELFFRGVLLPKMEGVFGDRAWMVNGVMFATYHVHKIEYIPVFIMGSIFTSYLNQRYRSFYPGLIIHGVEFIPIFVFITLFVADILDI